MPANWRDRDIHRHIYRQVGTIVHTHVRTDEGTNGHAGAPEAPGGKTPKPNEMSPIDHSSTRPLIPSNKQPAVLYRQANMQAGTNTEYSDEISMATHRWISMGHSMRHPHAQPACGGLLCVSQGMSVRRRLGALCLSAATREEQQVGKRMHTQIRRRTIRPQTPIASSNGPSDR